MTDLSATIAPKLPKHNGPRPLPVRERIERNIMIVDSGCWIWLGSITRNGYGQITTGSTHDGTRRLVGAHRAAYEAFVGPIPLGMDIDHLCRVRACVNWQHLEAVTRRENLSRGEGFVGVQSRKPHCPKCGGQYTRDTRSHRRCLPCAAAREREKRASRRIK